MIKIYVAIEFDDGQSETMDQVACIERSNLTPGIMRMALSEAKSVLQGIQ